MEIKILNDGTVRRIIIGDSLTVYSGIKNKYTRFLCQSHGGTLEDLSCYINYLEEAKKLAIFFENQVKEE